MKRIAFYSGSFDPVTDGHLDILHQGAAMFDEVVIGIGVHPGKKPLFSFEEREALIHASVDEIKNETGAEISVVAFDNLVVDAAEKAGASAILRGLRDGTDLDYEMQMAGMNGTMRPSIRTVFLPASPSSRHITATLVRQIAAMGGDISAFVPAPVHDALTQKFNS